MAPRGISEVEQLLEVKAHVIRYWEKEIPLVQPAKDLYGRRVYSNRDLQILLRLKYLLYERRFTIEGAKAQLYEELSGDTQDLRARISALRSNLLDIFFLVHEPSSEKRNNNTAEKEKAAGDSLRENSI